jgi:hypothetical protein
MSILKTETPVECPRCKRIQIEPMGSDKTAWKCEGCNVVWETTPDGDTRYHRLARVSTTVFDPRQGCFRWHWEQHRPIHPLYDKPDQD